MALGGYRPGSGRKPGKASKKKKAEMELLKEKLLPHMQVVIDAMMAKCKAGDSTMIREYWDRTIGKVPQAMDLTSKGESIVIPILGGANVSGNDSNSKDNGANKKD